MIDDNFSIDSIWDSSIRIQQSRGGYRFALDAVLLAHFLQIEAHEDALEIGCGNGIIPVLLSRLRKYRSIVAVEIQPEMAKLARINVEKNHAENVEVVEGDALHLDTILNLNKFNLLYSNPPYRKTGTGKLNPSHEKAIARHEIHLRLEDLALLGDRFLKNEGRLTVILPFFREKDWLQSLKKNGYTVSQRRYVHSFKDQPPAFLLATATKKSTKTDEFDPLVIYEKPGRYTDEMDVLLKRR